MTFMNTPVIRLAVMSVAVAAFTASAFAQLFPTPTQQADRNRWGQMWSEAAGQHREFIVAFNHHIAEARERFWSTFPDKPGSADASAKFMDLLNQKDIYFMSVAL